MTGKVDLLLYKKTFETKMASSIDLLLCKTKSETRMTARVDLLYKQNMKHG